jgi:hypothetical protein
MLNGVMLSVVMPSVVMPSVVMLNVVMLNVVAPITWYDLTLQVRKLERLALKSNASLTHDPASLIQL